jgi:hypothetical protein
VDIAVDKKLLVGVGAAIVLLLAVWLLVLSPQQGGGAGAPSASPSAAPNATASVEATPSAGAGAAAPENLNPSRYKDSTASFIVELANAIKKMVD